MKKQFRLTPLTAIRLKCLDCSGNSAKEIRFCTIDDCPLYIYRFGKNPKRKGIGGSDKLRTQKKLLQQNRKVD